MDLGWLPAELRLEQPSQTNCAPHSVCLGTGQQQRRDIQGKHLNFSREGGFISLEAEHCACPNRIITE